MRLAYPLSAIQEANRHIGRDLLEAALVAALIAMLLAIVATHSISRRLVRITDFAERVAAGDLSARIQEESTDEIAHVASALDKTARKLEDGFRALENSRQTLEALLNSMQEAVIAVAQDGRVLWANQRMERLLPSGVRLVEPLVQSLRDPEILTAVQETLDTRDVTVANAAKIFSGRITTSPPRLCRRRCGGGVQIRLRSRGWRKRGGISSPNVHELRIPLTSIQGYSETVLENPVLRRGQRDLLEDYPQECHADGQPYRGLAGVGAGRVRRAELQFPTGHAARIAGGCGADL